MISDALKEDIKRQLPELLREDPEFREYILDIARPKFADKKDTQDRFYEILADLQRDREEQAKKWEEHREWLKAQEKERKEHREWLKAQEKERKEHREWVKAQDGKWKEHNGWVKTQDEKWKEQDRKWWENQALSEARFQQTHFERKARFYEKRHNRTANRLIVISPMVDPKARKVADRLGIEIYSDSVDVESL